MIRCLQNLVPFRRRRAPMEARLTQTPHSAEQHTFQPPSTNSTQLHSINELARKLALELSSKARSPKETKQIYEQLYNLFNDHDHSAQIWDADLLEPVPATMTTQHFKGAIPRLMVTMGDEDADSLVRIAAMACVLRACITLPDRILPQTVVDGESMPSMLMDPVRALSFIIANAFRIDGLNTRPPSSENLNINPLDNLSFPALDLIFKLTVNSSSNRAYLSKHTSFLNALISTLKIPTSLQILHELVVDPVSFNSLTRGAHYPRDPLESGLLSHYFTNSNPQVSDHAISSLTSLLRPAMKTGEGKIQNRSLVKRPNEELQILAKLVLDPSCSPSLASAALAALGDAAKLASQLIYQILNSMDGLRLKFISAVNNAPIELDFCQPWISFLDTPHVGNALFQALVNPEMNRFPIEARLVAVDGLAEFCKLSGQGATALGSPSSTLPGTQFAFKEMPNLVQHSALVAQVLLQDFSSKQDPLELELASKILLLVLDLMPFASFKNDSGNNNQASERPLQIEPPIYLTETNFLTSLDTVLTTSSAIANNEIRWNLIQHLIYAAEYYTDSNQENIAKSFLRPSVVSALVETIRGESKQKGDSIRSASHLASKTLLKEFLINIPGFVDVLRDVVVPPSAIHGTITRTEQNSLKTLRDLGVAPTLPLGQGAEMFPAITEKLSSGLSNGNNLEAVAALHILIKSSENKKLHMALFNTPGLLDVLEDGCGNDKQPFVRKLCIHVVSNIADTDDVATACAQRQELLRRAVDAGNNSVGDGFLTEMAFALLNNTAFLEANAQLVFRTPGLLDAVAHALRSSPSADARYAAGLVINALRRDPADKQVIQNFPGLAQALDEAIAFCGAKEKQTLVGIRKVFWPRDLFENSN